MDRFLSTVTWVAPLILTIIFSGLIPLLVHWHKISRKPIIKVSSHKVGCQSQAIYLVHTAHEERKTSQKYSTKQLASFQIKVPRAVYLLLSLYHPKRRKCYVTHHTACSSKINHLGQLAGNVQ